MIDLKFREKQIRRMAGLDKYPKFEPEAEGELTIVAGRFGRSEAHLRGVIDEIMAVWTIAPKPSELRAMLDKDRTELVDVNCPHCHGSGWRIVERADASGATRCRCGSVPAPPSESRFHPDHYPSRSDGTVSPMISAGKELVKLTPVDEDDWIQ